MRGESTIRGLAANWDIEVERRDFGAARVVERPQERLEEGEVLLAVERLALTANVLTYASLGESLRYWELFPATSGRGRIPAWGYGSVAASRAPDFATGAHYFGLFPMSSQLVVRPRKTRAGFADQQPHRRPLNPVYNQYFDAGPRALAEMENNALFRPLVIAAFVLNDYLRESSFFGADAVLITSASSKTALALAMLLEGAVETVGATSLQSLAFVEPLGVYSRTFAYGAPRVDSARKTLIVDFAGDEGVLAQIETQVGDSLARVCRVGRTHWQTAAGGFPEAARDRVEFFFAPTHIERLVRDWGADRFEQKLVETLDAFALRSNAWFSRTYVDGSAGLIDAYRNLAAHKIGPSHLLVARPNTCACP